jgi:hypothetical protein
MEEVSYSLEDGTTVRFETDAATTFSTAGAGDKVVTAVKEAVQPAVDAAKLVLDRLEETKPSEVSVTFGVKVSGGAQWVVARAAGEANFTVTMVWRRDAAEDG